MCWVYLSLESEDKNLTYVMLKICYTLILRDIHVFFQIVYQKLKANCPI